MLLVSKSCRRVHFCDMCVHVFFSYESCSLSLFLFYCFYLYIFNSLDFFFLRGKGCIRELKEIVVTNRNEKKVRGKGKVEHGQVNLALGVGIFKLLGISRRRGARGVGVSAGTLRGEQDKGKERA